MNFPTIALIGRYQDAGLDTPLKAIAQVLKETGREVLIESITASNTGLRAYNNIASIEDIGRKANLAIITGGDGTVLSAARHLAPYGVPILGINHGRLGFITSIPMDETFKAIMSIMDGSYISEERILLEGKVWHKGKQIYSNTALNDVVLNRSGVGGMIEVKVELNDVFMYTQRADGLIIATPTGSTAYALSSNGPILHPELSAMVLVAVAPQTLSNRPVVIPYDGILKMTLITVGRTEIGASVHFDMQTLSELYPGDYITVQKSKYKAKFIHPEGYSFFSTLRQKLNWNVMPISSEMIE
ncbi:NAD+ kinase [Candidatus Kinetoplastibacterium desouzaii TCC079E]|uniref:NAD kinase n=1 Tax=Candidatus Kinetoplastidibacterium desouzai TCC079E TaxID=1208919 RepID=M1LMX6_9PROT|nr:NAD kinase [Candidatus Kinetoplastibacterium desouzaii]AGF47077.1 NAD+ kinase [Candidatus Kinetoplastibacterium desouzaii TCC079E]